MGGPSEHSSAQRISALLGLGAHLVLAIWYFLYTPLFAPLPGSIGLWAAWLGLLVLAVRWWRAHPFRVLAVPFAAAVVWMAGVWLGPAVLGWTA